MNKNTNPLIDEVPAAKELRKVPGFDPLKYLRTVTRNGEKVLKLDLRYKRLWFRLACPNGRVLLNPLRITDQMAIIEARVYAGKDDATPLANFTSTQMARNVPGGLYIRAAQDDALNEALDNAGFGIQLCDIAEVSDGSGLGSELPLSQVEGGAWKTTAAGDPVSEPPVETPEADAVSVEASAEDTAPVESSGPDTPAASVSAAREPAAAVEDTVQHHEMSEQPAAETAQPDSDAEVQVSYTEDMTVEEIRTRMTLEEARDILVPLGTCKGWTLGQVADRRAASLKWYVVGCSGASNVLKAGAALLLDAMQQRKAG